MPTISHDGITVEVDDDGYLADPEVWNDHVARVLAHADGIDELTDDHWTVIRYLRWHHGEFGSVPMIRKLCKETGFKLTAIYRLFPGGPTRSACKVAGLDKPEGCV
ncbi:TusE/DsrC/DsvC family sulfur relay protein [bacterium]|nr:TusE/DsrC/DsvC family sulfur relay protein [bacterium]